MGVKTHLSLDSLVYYTGAFYTRSKFTLKTFAVFGYAFSIIMGGFYVRSKVTRKSSHQSVLSYSITRHDFTPLQHQWWWLLV